MDKKKLAAAISAVFTYIKTSEEAADFASQQSMSPDMAAQSCQTIIQQTIVQQGNIWGVSGRQTHMQANSMMQMRMFK